MIPEGACQDYRFLRAGWVFVWTSFSLRMDTGALKVTVVRYATLAIVRAEKSSC
jgi:hypothetical protein